MNKPSRSFPRPLSDLLVSTLSGAFKQQGFASGEILARWADIVGPEIAVHCEPMKINWPRQNGAGTLGEEPPEPATLLLRVEGPAALEIQHMSAVILERVNRFFGWHAVGRLTIRQAPLSRRDGPKRPRVPDAKAVAQEAASLTAVEDDDLRAALARLGASIKRN